MNDLETKRTNYTLAEFLEVGDVLDKNELGIRNSNDWDTWGGASEWHESLGLTWDNGVGSSEALHTARRGDNQLVARARDLKIPAVTSSATAFKSSLDLMGGSVDVGSYLSGNPVCFRRRTRVTKPARSIRVFWGIMPSAQWTANQLLERSMYLLSLVEACQTQQINVELYVVFEGGHGETRNQKEIVSVEIPTQPLDLSQISFVLAHPAFARNVGYPIITHISGGRWDDWNGYFRGDSRSWVTRARQILSLNPEDIYVPSPRYDDPISAQWVAQQIEKLNLDTK